jgi:hypothetical protein
MIRGFFEDDKSYFEMANLRNRRTGLPCVIWIQQKSGKEQHNARIKVSKKYGDKVFADEGLFTITIPDKGIIGDTGDIAEKDIKKIVDFIDMNMEVLLKVWEGEIDSDEAVFVKV